MIHRMVRPPDRITRPIRWDRLRADEAERLIRERLANAAKVIFTDHAFDRVEERTIAEIEARNILRKGHVEGDPERSGKDWKVVMVRRLPGERAAGVVTVILAPPSETLIVVTVEWMDFRR